MEKQKTGWVACDASVGDHISEHFDLEIRKYWYEAIEDIKEENQDVRFVGKDGYLYVDENDALEGYENE